jgi:Flp pilus assembly protein CpaB
MLDKLADVIGRVLAHDKNPGYVFTEADFLPKGTREGVVAGIPAGKRAVRISADKVEGLYGLHSGDRFDLLATMPVDAARGGAQAFDVAGVYGQQLAMEARLSNWQKQATVRVLVQSGVIVEAMATRGVPMFQSSLTEGGVTRVRPVQEAVIAINPEEVARLTEAMAVNATITAVPRSGRPDDQIDSRTPDLHPVNPFTGPASDASPTLDPDGAGTAPFTVVETIMGQKRELTAVPRP